MSTPYQLFLDLPDDEYAALKADIAEHGVQVAVEYDDTGEILDGHHRVRAWTELVEEGVELDPYPCVIREGLTEAQKRSHVRRLNMLRRHLSEEAQQQYIRDEIREAPERSNRQIAKQLSVGHPRVARVRSEMEEAGDVERRSTSTDTLGRQQRAHRLSTRRSICPDCNVTYTDNEHICPSSRERSRMTVSKATSLPGFVMPELETESEEERAYYALARQRLVVRLDPELVAATAVDPESALPGFEEWEAWAIRFVQALRGRASAPIRRVK